MDTVLWWHLHQPDYRDPGGRTAQLPWVRMHALRAYTDLCAFALDTELNGMTINVVPSLADQLQDIATGACEDHHHALARRVAEGDSSAHAEAFARHAAGTPVPLIPLPHLDFLREKAAAQEKVTADDVTDACALFHLSWVGFTLGERKDVAAMLARGRGFTRDDVAFLLELSRSASSEVLQRFRMAREAGVIHLTTTPYFHPILPLVIDGSCASAATSDGGAPSFSAPHDARTQIERAAIRHEELFGERPKAMWPSEGALSNDAAHMIADAGFEVAASDEELLRRSLDATGAHDVHLHPWKHESSGLHLLFRDRALSDDWGFVYRDRQPDDAARAFTDGIQERHERGGKMCAVILDGENPFEFYPAAGRDHLRAFAALAKQRLHLVAPEHAASRSPQKLKRLKTGSWIHASLDIWAGDDEDRRAWKLLEDVHARIDLEKLSAQERNDVEHHLFAAEGSDWFWWYGPEFDIPDSPAFDALFRGHLRAAFGIATAANALHPAGDDVSHADDDLRLRLERAVAHPAEKVRQRNCPPWNALMDDESLHKSLRNAIHLRANEDGGAMHRGAPVIEEIWVMTTVDELSVVYAARGDVESVTSIFSGEVTTAKTADGLKLQTTAKREQRRQDGAMQQIGARVIGSVSIRWSEIAADSSVDTHIRLEVRGAAGEALDVVPSGGLLIRRPRTTQFEA